MQGKLLSAVVAMLVLTVLPFPYAYFEMLRVVVTAGALYLIWHSNASDPTTNSWKMAFGFIALLFNPVDPIHLDRSTWLIFDIGTAGVFLAYINRKYTSFKL